MKHYTYKTISDFDNNNTFFFTKKSNKSTNYSKMLDDIILADIMNQNKYLKKTSNPCNEADKLICAINTLLNYKKNPIKTDIGKLYTIGNIPVIFYDDEIQIGFDIFSCDDLKNISFIDALTPKVKNDIIKIAIKINI